MGAALQAPAVVAADGAGAGATDDAAAKKAAVPEPAFEQLDNPARVLPAQQAYVALAEGARYRPIKQGLLADIVVLEDLHPSEPEALVTMTTPSASGGGAFTRPRDA
jgi:26S proteasome regulatory subunit N2